MSEQLPRKTALLPRDMLEVFSRLLLDVIQHVGYFYRTVSDAFQTCDLRASGVAGPETLSGHVPESSGLTVEFVRGQRNRPDNLHFAVHMPCTSTWNGSAK